jgi:hypothetical protein
MAIQVKRPRGRPTFTEVALVDWAFLVATELANAQVDLGFEATGDASQSYEVEIVGKNKVSIYWAEYLKFSVAGRGRKPGGGMAPINEIVDWLEVKGIEPDDDKSIRSLAFAIAKKQQAEGNQVYRGERPGIPVDLIIQESFDNIADELAFKVAVAASELLIKNINSYKKNVNSNN